MDRRVQRTRKLLQDALLDLITQKDYDAVTVQDIIEQANVGRTTFYAHYGSKEDLFLDCHHELSHQMGLMIHSEQDLLAAKPDPALNTFFELLQKNRTMYFLMRRSPAWLEISRGLQSQVAARLRSNFNEAFDETASIISFELLANYIAGAQLAFANWWLESRADHSAQKIAEMVHRMRAAAIREAFDRNNKPHE